jgi:hypothetical protein
MLTWMRPSNAALLAVHWYYWECACNSCFEILLSNLIHWVFRDGTNSL